MEGDNFSKRINAMGLLTNLNLSVARDRGKETPEQRLRNRVITALREQKDIFDADAANRPLVLTRRKAVKNADGSKSTVELARRLRRWFWQDAGTGEWVIEVKYAGRAVELAKGKALVRVGDASKLPATIDTLILAVKAGELDQQLKAAHEQRAAKKKKVKAV